MSIKDLDENNIVIEESDYLNLTFYLYPDFKEKYSETDFCDVINNKT